MKRISSLDRWLMLEHPRLFAKMTRPRCGARTKATGQPCQARALTNGRCKFHGGASTGPRTEAGRERALRNLRQFRGKSAADRSE
jgi:hypothetical protein